MERIEILYEVLALLEAMEEDNMVAAVRWAIFELERGGRGPATNEGPGMAWLARPGERGGGTAPPERA